MKNPLRRANYVWLAAIFLARRFFAGVSLLFATSAFPAEKITLQLSPNEMGQISGGLAALDGEKKVVKDQLGRDQVVTVPYDIPDARLTIAHDDAIVILALREFQVAIKGVTPEEAAKMADKKVPINLLSFDVAVLKLSANNIVPSALAALAPVCPTCAGMDAPAASPTPTKP